MAKHGNDFLEVWNANLPHVIASEGYGDLCAKYELENLCFNSTTAPVDTQTTPEAVYRIAKIDTEGNSDFESLVLEAVCLHANVSCEIIPEHASACYNR